MKYAGILEFPKDGAASKAVGAALDRAHDLRRFEIENYWRRSTYFWGFQLAALAALAIARQSGQLDPHVLTIIAILGMVTAYTGFLTAKGSKFWQRNWESHVDLLEDTVEGKLHKTVFVRSDGLAPSVSQASERLWLVLTVGWVLAFFGGLILIAEINFDATFSLAKAAEITILGVAGIVAMAWMGWTPLSGVQDRAYDYYTLDRWVDDQST